MIDNDELPVSDEDEAFLEQWLKLWYLAAETLTAAGWRPRLGFHTDFWLPPKGIPRTVWAEQCVSHDAHDARQIKARTNDPLVIDAADAMLALSFVVEAIAKPGVDRSAVRAGALWGMNSATILLRRHLTTGPISAALEAEAARDMAARELESFRAIAAPIIAANRKRGEKSAETNRARAEAWRLLAYKEACRIRSDRPTLTTSAIAKRIWENASITTPDRPEVYANLLAWEKGLKLPTGVSAPLPRKSRVQ